MAITEVDLSDTIATWRTKTNTISTNVGDLSNLNTTEDSDLVGAINEVQGQLAGIDSDVTEALSVIGTLASLNTTDKSSIVAALNETYDRIPNVYDDSDNLLNT